MLSQGRRRRTDLAFRTRIIACGVFRPALKHLRLVERYRLLSISFLPSYLHMHPRKLKRELHNRINAAKMRRERVICLYGNCFPGIDELCAETGALRIAAAHCYELFIGSDRFRQIVEGEVGSYFLESDLIANFEAYCLKPLELYDDEMRRLLFGNYKRLIYVRQPADLDLVPRVKELADFLELSHEVVEADYCELERKIRQLI